MSNFIGISGYIYNLKPYPNDDGSVKLYFTISSRTNDPKRYKEQNNNRDFFSVDLYINKSRTGVLEKIKNGKYIGIAGVPYESIGKDGNTRYFNIRANIDSITFHPVPEQNQNTNGGQTNQPVNTVNQQPQQQGNYNPGGNPPPQNPPQQQGQSW